MDLVCQKSTLKGEVAIPASKSHTIRAVALAALAKGESRIRNPLVSEDARAAVIAYKALNAQFEEEPGLIRVQGVGGEPRCVKDVIDVGNSGTTLRIALGSCALIREGTVTIDGDEQIRRRPAGPLVQSLNELGGHVVSSHEKGCAPFTVGGRLRGGATTIECPTSQYLTSLLINAPLAEEDTVITVPLLNERPYVDMTLAWLKRQGVRIDYDDYSAFHIPGGQAYAPVDREIPSDFSSATFFLGAGALGDNDIVSTGLDMNDTQGDKAVVDYLREMGARVEILDSGLRVAAQSLKGCELDLNATPDALPMMAVAACFAEGTTSLVNVPQARLKETDRIAVMKMELEKLGASVEERPDGLVVRESALHGGEVDGHGDHRVIMALAIAGTLIDEPVTIHGCEAIAVTYPGFVDDLARLGGDAHTLEETVADR